MELISQEDLDRAEKIRRAAELNRRTLPLQQLEEKVTGIIDPPEAGPYASGYVLPSRDQKAKRAVGGVLGEIAENPMDFLIGDIIGLAATPRAIADLKDVVEDAGVAPTQIMGSQGIPSTLIDAYKSSMPGKAGQAVSGALGLLQEIFPSEEGLEQRIGGLPTDSPAYGYGKIAGGTVGEVVLPFAGGKVFKVGKPVVNFLKNTFEKGTLTAPKYLQSVMDIGQTKIVPDGPKGGLAKVPPRPREVDPEGFYSVVQEAIPLIKRGKGTGQEFVDEMRSKAVKQGYSEKSFNNEIKAMGLNLGSEFTKEDFVQHLNDKRFTVNVVENKPSGLPSEDNLFFNEIETVGYEELSVVDKDFFENEVKAERRDLIRSSLEKDLSEGYSISPELDREAAFNKAALLKAFDEKKTEFIDVDGNTQDFEDKIDSIAYDIAKENYEDPSRAYQRVPVVIDGDEKFTLFRGGKDMPWQLREGGGDDGMLWDNTVKANLTEDAIVSEDNLAEAEIQTRLYLQDEGFLSFEGDEGLEHMHQNALTDLVNVDGTQPNRREILITSPEVGEFTDHFKRTDDTVVASVMASDWDGPIATTKGNLPASNKVLYGDELQSDHAMANSRYWQKIKIREEGVRPLLDDLKYLADELRKFQSNKLPPVTQSEEIIDKPVTMMAYDDRGKAEIITVSPQSSRAIETLIEGISRFNKSMTQQEVSEKEKTKAFIDFVYFFKNNILTVANDRSILRDGVFAKDPRLMSILYSENTLFDKLTSVNEKMMGIRGPSTDVPNPWQDTWHELALKKLMKTAVDEGYDYVMVPKSETLVAKWGEGAVEGRKGAYRKMYQTVYDRKIPSFLKKYAKQYNSELIDAELGESGVSDLYKGMSVPETTLIKITPEMKEAAKEGQPLFNIAVGTAAGAGALSTLDQEEQVY